MRDTIATSTILLLGDVTDEAVKQAEASLHEQWKTERGDRIVLSGPLIYTEEGYMVQGDPGENDTFVKHEGEDPNPITHLKIECRGVVL